MAFYANGELKKEKLICQIKNIFYVFTLFSVVQWCFKYFLPQWVNSGYGIADLLLFAIKPMSPYWYLWVMVIYYCFFVFGERKRITEKLYLIISLIVSLAGSFISTGFSKTPKNILFFIFPFALGSFVFKKSRDFFEKKQLITVTLIITIVFFSVLIVRPIEIEGLPILSVILGTAISITLIGFFVRHKFCGNNRFLQYVGRYSLEIYVMHCFITAPMRKLLIVLGIQNVFWHTLISLIIAIALPIAVTVFLKKIEIYKFVFKPFSLLK